jgi:hypothetical protein
VRIPALAFVALFTACSAQADATRDALLEIAKCADIADSAERLKCFDAAIPHARNALAPSPQKAEDDGGILRWFGFARPNKPVVKPEDFGKPPAPAPAAPENKELTELSAGVVEFAKTSRGRAGFILDNGQVWKQLDSDSTDVLAPPTGTTMKVTIEVGFLGSYNLTMNGSAKLYKVTRLK